MLEFGPSWEPSRSGTGKRSKMTQLGANNDDLRFHLNLVELSVRRIERIFGLSGWDGEVDDNRQSSLKMFSTFWYHRILYATYVELDQ